jgi:hypothetical protein
MATTSKLTDAAALEQYRVAFENATNQTEIATVLADLGYDSTKIDEEKALLETTRNAYDLNKTEDDETSAADTTMQTQLALLKITVEDITAVNTKVAELEAVRAEYLKEKGESQDATKAKDAAFATLDDWMSGFYAVAKIGLEDNPQLLEAIGKTIKS